MNGNLLSKAVKITSPVFFGYIAIGIGFGILLVNAGYPWWLSPLMGMTMFTGAGQYFAVGLFASGSRLPEIMLVELLLSLRHIFYGLSLITKYKNAGVKKPYMIFAITDETFALVQGVEVPENTDKFSFYTIVSALDQFYWVLGSTIGAVTYEILAHYELTKYLEGVDFALTSLFIVLLIGQLQSSKDFVPSVVGGLAAAASVALYKFNILGSSNIIWISICAGLGAMLMLRGRNFYRTFEPSKPAGEKEK